MGPRRSHASPWHAALCGLLILISAFASSAQEVDSVPEGAAEHSFTLVSGGAPRILLTDRLIQVSVLLRNDGSRTWDPEQGHRLTYRWLSRGGDRVLVEGLRTSIPGPTAGGTRVQFDAWLKAPASPGLYRLQWDMAYGLVWFSSEDPTPERPITVLVLPRGRHLLVLALSALVVVLALLGRLLARRHPPRFFRDALARQTVLWQRRLSFLAAFFDNRPGLSLSLICLGAVVVKVPYVLGRGFPTVFGDATLYAYKARNIFTFGSFYAPAGTPDVYDFAAPLYSLALAPAFLLSDDPRVTFPAMLLINALLIASMIYPCYRIAEAELPSWKWLVALAAGIWSVPFCYAFEVMSEALFIPLFMWAAYFYMRSLKTPSFRHRLGFGVLVAALILTRNAGIAMFGVVGLVVLVSRSSSFYRLAEVREMIRRLPMAVPAVVCWGGWKIWQGQHYDGGPKQSTAEYLAWGTFRASLDFYGTCWKYVQVWAQQVSYLNLATFNLLVVLVFFFLLQIGRKSSENRGQGGLIGLRSYLLLSSVLAMAPSSIYLVTGRRWANMHGRYVDVVVPVVVMCTIWAIGSGRQRWPRRRVAVAALVSGALFLVLYAAIPSSIGDTRVVNVGAAWYQALVEQSGMPKWSWGLLSLCFVLVVVNSARCKWSRAATLSLLLVLNLYNTHTNFRLYERYDARHAAVSQTLETVRESGGRLFFVEGGVPKALMFQAQYYLYQRARPYHAEGVDRRRDFVACGEEILPAEQFFAAYGGNVELCGQGLS